MNLLPYIEHLQRQLLAAADAGGPDARAIAERLTAPLESAARLVLLDALSNAAAEITRELAPGSVDVRLRGVDPEFVVATATEPSWSEARDAEAASTAGLDDDDAAISRTTLRLPEHLKVRVEQAAAREGLSVNTWLVRAISSALDGDGGRRPTRPSGEQSFTGWARS